MKNVYSIKFEIQWSMMETKLFGAYICFIALRFLYTLTFNQAHMFRFLWKYAPQIWKEQEHVTRTASTMRLDQT